MSPRGRFKTDIRVFSLTRRASEDELKSQLISSLARRVSEDISGVFLSNIVLAQLQSLRVGLVSQFN